VDLVSASHYYGGKTLLIGGVGSLIRTGPVACAERQRRVAAAAKRAVGPLLPCQLAALASLLEQDSRDLLAEELECLRLVGLQPETLGAAHTAREAALGQARARIESLRRFRRPSERRHHRGEDSSVAESAASRSRTICRISLCSPSTALTTAGERRCASRRARASILRGNS
jgi:hypothetical protein